MRHQGEQRDDEDAAGVGARTGVGAGGRRLAGPERRRLCVRRGAAARPRLLLLDEPAG
ncbi:hypothetical protein [Nakamurella aerolata]|uniref:ATP-binding cassette domain-containing protein n=1 Tax=Nakamurella aerolata TaxID=1656892 RepID=A0A849AJ61_9ACTN|nr:hypothetical protein [Nakamurella aerolata]NNG36842.1 hypothetical protein [Nakamurella aerolata]